MKKGKIIIGTMMLSLMLLTGCKSNSDKSADNSVTTEAISSASEAEWSTTDTENKDEAVWNSTCEDLKSSLKELDWVENVSITPETYNDYVAEGSVTITCKAVEGREVSNEDEESVKKYIDSVQYFEKYDLCIE